MVVNESIEGVYAIVKDITKQNELQEKIRQMAYHDQQTGLPNQNLLNKDFNKFLINNKFALLFLDLDNFKNVNDTYGHNIGDKLLNFVGERLKKCIREGDRIYRLGGDEFILVLKDVVKKAIIKITRRIIEKLNSKFVIEGNEIYISSSVGISRYPVDSEVFDNLIKYADNAMYEVKNTGKNNFKFYSK